MKQHNVVDENTVFGTKETPVAKMEKSLLPKKEICDRKAKAIQYQQTHLANPI